MTWQDRMRAEMDRAEMPAFLTDLQALVAGVREGRTPTVTPRLRAHQDLVLDATDHHPDVVAALQREHGDQ